MSPLFSGLIAIAVQSTRIQRSLRDRPRVEWIEGRSDLWEFIASYNADLRDEFGLHGMDWLDEAEMASPAR